MSIPISIKRIIRFCLSAISVMALCFAGDVICAEEFSISGTVEDVSGEAIEEAKVSLFNAQQTLLRESKSSSDGKFTLSNIPPGSYLLIVKSEAFAENVSTVFVKNGPVDVKVILELNKVEESVTVTAQLGQVEDPRSVSQQVNVISEEEIQERATTVISQIAQEEVGLYSQRTSPTIGGIFIRGLTGTKVNAFVDGVRYTTASQRGGVSSFLNMIEPTFLQSAEILRGPNSAQYGSDALGGSMQFLSRNPIPLNDRSWGAHLGSYFNSSDNGFGLDFASSYQKDNFALMVDLAGRRVNRLRPGEGIDSHNAVTRFFDLSSSLVVDNRLPDTAFTQYGGMLKTVWSLSGGSFITANYIRSQQDDGKRYDQLIGGDGNLIADLNHFTMDLFYLKYEKLGLGWFDNFTATYSFNSQREERVNQGGNGNPRASINFEPERTNVNGFQAQAGKQLGERHSLFFGAEFYHERVDAPSEGLNPVTEVFTPRRGRVPDGSRYDSWGVYAQDVIEVIPTKLKLTGNLRYSYTSYKSQSKYAPLSSNGEPLWPNDSVNNDYVSFRTGALYTPTSEWSLMANISSGFRSPNITDLGTLGLTGSGFEVDAAEVAGLGATIGSTADRNAISTGLSVTQLEPETSLNYEFGTRFNKDRIDSEVVFFLTDIDSNIAKQSLILPQGAIGLTLGDEVITSQSSNGVVFVSASTNPVLVRANFDEARIYGVEYELEVQIAPDWYSEGGFTYIHAEDKRTGLPPNIEGGTPAPNGYLKLKYSPTKKNFWIEPYVFGATKQDRLSSLDLEDRRTGAGRSSSSITNFFRNGATARGLVGPGPDQIFGSADDVLLSTGETLSQVIARVLGPDGASDPLFNHLPGYLIYNVRFGFRLGQSNEFLIDFQNIGDSNYRGISWGLDAPGRGIYFRYLNRF